MGRRRLRPETQGDDHQDDYELAHRYRTLERRLIPATEDRTTQRVAEELRARAREGASHATGWPERVAIIEAAVTELLGRNAFASPVGAKQSDPERRGLYVTAVERGIRSRR